MDLKLAGKSVVVTGGSMGIGKATALTYLKEGAKVSILARRLEKLEATQKEFKELGYDVAIYSADVSCSESIQSAVDAIVKDAGGIDIWVNNAGLNISKHSLEYTKEDYDQIMNADFFSVYEACRIVGRQMINQGRGGVILNVSSYSAVMGHAGAGLLYTAAKTAVSSLTKTFAAVFAPYGIRVVGVKPGFVPSAINVEQIKQNYDFYVSNVPLHRLGTPEDIAGPLVMLTSDVCSYITGFDIEVTGGKYSVQDNNSSWDYAAEHPTV